MMEAGNCYQRRGRMRDNVLWRKEASIIAMLASTLGITDEESLDLFYATHTYGLLANPQSGLRLMSDGYIVDDILSELKTASAEKTVSK